MTGAGGVLMVAATASARAGSLSAAAVASARARALATSLSTIVAAATLEGTLAADAGLGRVSVGAGVAPGAATDAERTAATVRPTTLGIGFSGGIGASASGGSRGSLLVGSRDSFIDSIGASASATP